MNGKVAFVTGGAQGIGKAFCRELLRNGAKVIIGDIQETEGQETKQTLRKEFGDNIAFYVCDVTDSKQFKGCFEKAIEEFGGLDILVNNAGICDEAENRWKKMIDINLVAVVEGTKLGFKFMSKSGGGRGGIIVNIGSITALNSWDCIPVYSTTKSAVNELSKLYGTDLHYKESGVKVVSINPGLTRTNMVDDAKKTVSGSIRFSQEMHQSAKKCPVQNADHMGKGLIYVIKTADNGTVWVVENEKPPSLLA